MEIVRTQEPPKEIDCKRLYVPGYALKAACPSCGTEITVNFARRPLIYPIPDKTMTIGLMCPQEGCDTEWEAQIVLRLAVEVVREF
jgi:hypothetical protein